MVMQPLGNTCLNNDLRRILDARNTPDFPATATLAQQILRFCFVAWLLQRSSSVLHPWDVRTVCRRLENVAISPPALSGVPCNMNVSWKLSEPMDESTRGLALLPSSPSTDTPVVVKQAPIRGRHHIRVCRGLACHVKGSAAVLEKLQSNLGILPGEVTTDGVFSLEVVPCLDACGMSPVMAINEQLYPGVTPNQVESLIRDLSSE